ncbi:MAG: hypothetical protein CFE37_05330 [Alphaproteobacteria bacterium PA4]|nr:MAG: hypothetical protein CFE37_05330 [Alphaproteobacteria bacterium PA4]
MLARRFLWIIAIIIMLVIAAAVTYRLAGDRLIRAALTPSVAFEAPAGGVPDYALPANWAARPDLPKDPARWAPQGYAAAPRPGVAVFYVLPTGVFDRNHWNARLDDAEVNTRLDMFLRFQASIFNGVAAVWAPRYRQATFGSFLTDKPEAQRALDLAYGDVLAAFDAFVAAQPADRPIILAGHSQGSLHLLRLLKERVAGQPLARRIIAVYAAGWPISLTADLPALGVPACADADQTGCILGWQSFARPADYSSVRETFDRSTGLTGAPRRGTAILCTNPLSGSNARTAVPASANLGSLLPDADFQGGTLIAKGIGAQCLASGITDIGDPPGGYAAYVLPGNNYHVYDYPLFWANLRADVERRVSTFGAPVATHASVD